MTSTALPVVFDYAAATESGDRWIKLLPAGHFRLRDGRGGDLDTGDTVAMQQIVDRSLAYAGATDLMIDYDHESVRMHKGPGRAEAAGWIKEMQVRADGIYGRVEWTAAASGKIASKAYRYISPWFSALKGGRVYQILNAALVNMPALDLIAANQWIPVMDNSTLEARLRELLSLGADADAAAIIAAVEALSVSAQAASAAPDPAAYVPIAMFTNAVSEANKLRAGVSEGEAVRLVEATISAGAMIPALESWAVDLCKVNVPAFRSFLASTGPAVMSIFAESQFESVTSGNRRNDTERLSDLEMTIAATLDLSAAGFAAAKNT